MVKRKSSSTDALLQELRAFGLAYPGAHLKSPWPGHMDLAVNDKTFAYLSIEGEPLSISCKLPVSHEKAMMLPGAVPTAYGLGKSGWVTASFPDGAPPVGLLRDWIDESYRAQAPKRLLKSLDGAAPAPAKAAPAKKAAKKAARKAENSSSRRGRR